MKFFLLLITLIAFLLTILSAFFISAFSNLEINATNYSGVITTGSSSGNLTADTIDGSTAGFYQQAIGYLSNLLFTGIHGFSFNVSLPSGSPPTIKISFPENKTYLKDNIYLNFTSSNANYIWYHIDAGANTTITENTIFATSSGLQTLYLWANNSYGNSLDNITFTRNNTKLIILYNNYSSSKKGESNDFNSATYEDIQDLSNIILENTDYGKIKFNNAINLTDDLENIDNVLDLDSYTSISNNSIFINSTVLPNFNKTATLYLYNLGFTNPRVLRDGSTCPSTICTEVNYSGGIFVFNVTQFSNYSAEETPAEEIPATTSSGGGGGSSSTSSPTFALDKEQISVSLIPGQVITEEIIITNIGNQITSFKIENLFSDFIVRGEEVIVLNPGESRTIPLYILARVDIIPNLYLGKIVISSGNLKKEVLISIEIESKGILLDVRAEILAEYQRVLFGGEILTEIRLFNLGGELTKRKDILIEYIVRDYDGNEITKETESLAIETQATFIKRISLPKDIRLGNYVLYVRAIYNGKTASSSDNFEVVSSTVSEREKIYIVIIIILSIIISSIVYYILRRKRGKSHEKATKKVDLGKIMKK